MSSSNKTENLGLNLWSGTDSPKMEDFNADNRKIDLAAPIIGSYTGNGLAARDIELGFKASFGILFAVGQNIVQAIGSTGNMQVFSAFVSEQGSSQGVVMTDTGFQVLYNVNAVSNRLALTNVKDQVYVYIMFR